MAGWLRRVLTVMWDYPLSNEQASLGSPRLRRVAGWLARVLAVVSCIPVRKQASGGLAGWQPWVVAWGPFLFIRKLASDLEGLAGDNIGWPGRKQQ